MANICLPGWILKAITKATIVASHTQLGNHTWPHTLTGVNLNLRRSLHPICNKNCGNAMCR